MPNLSIKNVPEPVVERLRQRAAANHRSLQGELMALVCRVAEEGVASQGLERLSRLRVTRRAASRRGQWLLVIVLTGPRRSLRAAKETRLA